MVVGEEEYQDVIILVTRILWYIARKSKGSVYYLTWRKAKLILGEELGRGDFMKTQALLGRLGFERTVASGNTAFVINTRSPLMLRLRLARNLNTAVSFVRRYLGNGVSSDDSR
jgi:hypothetical protein